jgi:hypothetical protein
VCFLTSAETEIINIEYNSGNCGGGMGFKGMLLCLDIEDSPFCRNNSFIVDLYVLYIRHFPPVSWIKLDLFANVTKQQFQGLQRYIRFLPIANNEFREKS